MADDELLNFVMTSFVTLSQTTTIVSLICHFVKQILKANNHSMSSQGKLLHKYHKPDHMKIQPMHCMQMKLKLSMAFACQTTYMDKPLAVVAS